MTNCKRAIITIKRQWVKSLLIFSLTLVSMMLIMFIFFTQTSVTSTINNIRKNLVPITVIEFDNNTPLTPTLRDFITGETVRKIAALPYVAYHDFSLNASLLSFELDNWFPRERQSNDILTMSGFGYNMLNLYTMKNYTLFRLLGISRNDFLEIKFNQISIINGRVQTNDEINHGSNVAIISNNLALQNNLNIGDYFTMFHELIYFNIEMFEVKSIKLIPIELEIIGIFEINDLEEAREDIIENNLNWNRINPDHHRYVGLSNTIFIPNNVLEKIHNIENHERAQRGDFDNINYDRIGRHPMFVLSSSDYLEKFVEQASVYVPYQYVISTLLNRFQPLSHSLNYIKNIIDTFLIFILVVILALFLLIFFILLYDKRKEISIYLQLGYKKSTLYLQFIFEQIFIFFIALIIALIINYPLMNRISKNYLYNLITQFTENNETLYIVHGTDILHLQGFGGNLSIEEMMSYYSSIFDLSSVMISGGLIFIIFLTALLISSFSFILLKQEKYL